MEVFVLFVVIKGEILNSAMLLPMKKNERAASKNMDLSRRLPITLYLASFVGAVSRWNLLLLS